MKQLLFTLLMLAVATATMAAQEGLEKTLPPDYEINYYEISGVPGMVIVCYSAEVSVIHLLLEGEEVMQDDSGFLQYFIPSISEEQHFMAAVYAQAEGKAPSDTVEMMVDVPPLPILQTEPPYISYERIDPECGEYTYYHIVTIENSDMDPDAMIYYQVLFYENRDTDEWREYDGPLTFTEKGLYRIEAYAIAEGKSESDYVCCEFIIDDELPWWAEYDFIVDGIYYKILSDSTVSVCARTLEDIYEDPSMTHYGDYTGDVVIPETVEHDGKQYTVTAIDQMAFQNCDNLTGVSIPCTVTEIASNSFTYNETLNWIRVDARNPVFDSRGDCNAIIETQTNSLLVGCNGTTIPGTVTSIGDGAFWGSGLTGIDIPNSIISIGQVAFASSGLLSIEIPNSVTSIGDYAFRFCEGLNSVTIPNSVTSIGNGAFIMCRALNGIVIPDSVKSIGDWTFMDCSSLSSATIGSSVTSIGERAFEGCCALTSIDIPDSVTSIGQLAFEGCSSLSNLTIGNSVTTIGESAFENCTSLTDLTIGNSVTTIGQQAFCRCKNLTSITIPNSVSLIGGLAFGECDGLTSVICQAVEPSSGMSVFYSFNVDIYEQATLFVPNESLEVYRANEEWGKFSHIVPFIGAGPGDINGDGNISISDVTSIINDLLNGDDIPPYCDVNGDGRISISDVTTLINMLLSGN